MTDAPTPRKPGPQARAARNDRAVIDAAREVFLAQGFNAPVSAIAERAGVGMGSLYRRYRTKEELFQRLCVDSMQQVAQAAQEGLEIGDPWRGLAHYIQRSVAFGFGALAPLAGTVHATPEMWQAQQRAQHLADTLVARAHAAAVLRTDVTTLDISLLISQLNKKITAPAGEEEDNARERLLAIAIDGLSAHHTEPLPGRPPSLGRFQALWRDP